MPIPRQHGIGSLLTGMKRTAGMFQRIQGELSLSWGDKQCILFITGPLSRVGGDGANQRHKSLSRALTRLQDRNRRDLKGL